MFLRSVRLFFALGFVGFYGASARAEGEDASALATRARELYAELPNFQVTAVRRELRVVPSGGPLAGAAQGENRAYRVMNVSYQQVSVTRRLPDDWIFVGQRERENNGAMVGGRTVVLARRGGAAGELLVFDPGSQTPARSTVAGEQFYAEAMDRVGSILREDIVLGSFFPSAKSAEEDGRPVLSEVVRAGEENWRGAVAALLRGRRGNGATITIWVDTATGLIVRSVEVSAEAGPFRRVMETLYITNLGSGSENADFDADEGWMSVRPDIAKNAGFEPADVLLAAGGLRAGPSAVASGPGEVWTPPASTSVAAADQTAKSESPAQGQLLTAAQMEAIVMIEGESGVGTGFVTTIRDVDFVVTNLHVIGGNETLKITTIRGDTLKVGGIFGAVGRDIAILRIEEGPKIRGLSLAVDPLQVAKLGDRVAVVGNRRGGGVATQVSGMVRGIGPDRVEVDARFEPGNSGSPIVHVESGTVLGVASYSHTRQLDDLDESAEKRTGSTRGGNDTPKVEQRWFGYRTDEVPRWEGIDLTKWRAQAKRVSEFESDSQSIYMAMHGQFRAASANPRVRILVDRFEERYLRAGGKGSPQAAVEVTEFLRALRALAETGVRDLKTGEYYDFFRTSLYWQTSIPQQLSARADLADRLDRAAINSYSFMQKLRR